MIKPLSVTYYSDVLCAWAYVSQARVDEMARQFSSAVLVDYRFCSIFGDTAHKIGRLWKDRGGYAAYADHLRAVMGAYEHVHLHPDVWVRNPPTSSMPAHLLIKALQRVDPSRCEDMLRALRCLFFEQAQDISRWAILQRCIGDLEISETDMKEALDSGQAHADLEADYRDQQSLLVQGSPTYLLNEGRQKLYGNVGYGVIEANIRELLRSPHAGAASWC